MIRETMDGVLMEVRVKTNSNRFALTNKDGRLVLEITSPPQEGKANLEIVKGMKRIFRTDVEIVEGLKRRDKVLLIRGAKAAEIEKAIERLGN